MAYTPTSWKDRAVQYAKRYFLRDNGGSDKNLLPPFNEGWTLHENTRMKQANFVGKISASTVENPNIIKYGFNASLLSPSSATENTNQTQITNTSTLNGALNTQSGTTNLQVSQTVFSFDLIEHVLRNYGSSVFGVAVTTPERVAWLKLNVAKFNVNWHGYGSSPSGNKAYLGLWNTSSSLYDGTLNHTSGSVTKITQTSSNMTLRIDTSGFVHFIAYADASNGSTASTINTDFIELEVYMAAGSIPQADYTLLLNATAASQNSTVDAAILPNTNYVFSCSGSGTATGAIDVDQYDSTGTIIAGGPFTVNIGVGSPAIQAFTSASNAASVKAFLKTTNVGNFTFTNPQLELGSTPTTFAPMKSYDVTQAPGIVTQAGTPLNAANLNTLETGLQTAAATADTHIANQAVSVHGSTSANTASKLVHRDANARAQFADPSAAQDAATKNYVDTHANLTNPHNSTSAATASRLMLRDANGRVKVAAPNANDDVARFDTIYAPVDMQNTVPWAAAGLLSGNFGNVLYTVGVGNYAYCIVADLSYNKHQRYDPSTNTFSTMSLPSIAANYFGLGLCSDGTYIYLVAMSSQDNSNLKVYKYNISGNSWSLLTDVATPNTDGAGGYAAYPVISGSNIVFAYRRDTTTNVYFVKVDKSAGTATFLLETGDTFTPSGTFVSGSGDFYVLKDTANGNVRKINISSFTMPSTLASIAGNRSDYTPAGNPIRLGWTEYSSTMKTYKTTTADGATLDSKYLYHFAKVSPGATVFIPGLGRLVNCVDGSYQNFPELIGY